MLNFHGGDLLPLTASEKFNQLFVKRIALKADLLVVPSNYFKKMVSGKYGIEERKIIVYPSGGVDLNTFKPLDQTKIGKDVNSKQSWVLGCVSRIDEGKGWDTFLKALKILKALRPDLHFKAIFVGIGPMEKEFNRLINDLGLEQEISYLGEKNNNELPAIINSFDVFVFPTRLPESLGLVGLEAMACGVPIIASAIGGIKDYVIDDYSGFLFEAGNEQALCDKIIQVISMNEEERKRIIQQSLEVVKSYESEYVIKKLAEELRKLIVYPN